MTQFLDISKNYTLSKLSDRVGSYQAEKFLRDNGVPRSPNIGRAFNEKVATITENTQEVDWQRKASILNKMVDDSDVFEEAALSSENNWKVLSEANTFIGKLRVPDTITLPKTSDVLGNGEPVQSDIYDKVMNDLSQYPHRISPEIFNSYSVRNTTQLADPVVTGTAFNNIFPIPWGDITIYSQLSRESKDIPVYPEELQDSRSANYSTMPDMLYQYEPWYLYQGSGPRECTINFGTMHRDMWSGDHSDGKANELIRFFESMCYPEYDGSTVNTDIATLYIKGSIYVSGIVTKVDPKWSGPLLQDGWYACVDLSVSITEISNNALNREYVKSLPIIG
jgi:hypothetical protein